MYLRNLCKKMRFVTFCKILRQNPKVLKKNADNNNTKIKGKRIWQNHLI